LSAGRTEHGEIVYDQRNRLTYFPVDVKYGIERDIIIKRFNLTRKYDFSLMDLVLSLRDQPEKKEVIKGTSI
jgi:hypothetical protein